MSDPPRYSTSGISAYEPDSMHRAEDRPLLSADYEEHAHKADMSCDISSTVRQDGQAARGTGIDPVGSGRRMIVYRFQPTYLVAGEAERAVGPLGRTREETIGVARRAFPALLQFPNERIQFQIHGTEGGGDAASEEEMSRGLRVNFSIGMTGTRESSTSGMPEGEVQGHPYPQVEGWHNVLDEAWPYFEERPPEVIRVTVAPTQDEARTHARRDALIGNIMVSFCGGIFIIAVVLVFFTWCRAILS